VRPTDTLVDVGQLARPGTITIIMQPLYPGPLDELPQGGCCIANAYISNHEALQDPDIGTLRRFALLALGLLRVPLYIPPWVKDPRYVLTLLTYSTVMNGLELQPLQAFAERLLVDAPVVRL